MLVKKYPQEPTYKPLIKVEKVVNCPSFPGRLFEKFIIVFLYGSRTIFWESICRVLERQNLIEQGIIKNQSMIKKNVNVEDATSFPRIFSLVPKEV